MLGHLFHWVALLLGRGWPYCWATLALLLGRDSVSLPNPVLDIFGGVS